MAHRKPNGQILVEALVVLLLLTLCFSTVLQSLKSTKKKNSNYSLAKEDVHETRFSKNFKK
jgi:Tfp pilus assembly protein PilX